MVRQEVPGEIQRAAGLCRAQCVRKRDRLRAGDRDGEDDGAEGADQGARDRLVQRLVGGAGDLPASRGSIVAQLVAAADDPQIYQRGSDAVGRRRRLHAWRQMITWQRA